jgi:hypothetical protein
MRARSVIGLPERIHGIVLWRRSRTLTIVRITACYATSCLLPHSQSISVGVACFCVLDGPLGEVINCLLQCSSAGQRPTAPVHFQPSKCGVLMVLHRVAMVVVVIKGPPNKCAHVYLDVNTKEENPKEGATFLGSRRVTVRPDWNPNLLKFMNLVCNI